MSRVTLINWKWFSKHNSGLMRTKGMLVGGERGQHYTSKTPVRGKPARCLWQSHVFITPDNHRNWLLITKPLICCHLFFLIFENFTEKSTFNSCATLELTRRPVTSLLGISPCPGVSSLQTHLWLVLLVQGRRGVLPAGK